MTLQVPEDPAQDVCPVEVLVAHALMLGAPATNPEPVLVVVMLQYLLHCAVRLPLLLPMM